MSFCLPLAQNTWFWFWGRLIFLEKTVHREFLIKNWTCKNNKCVILFFVVGPKTMVLVDDDFYAALRIISKLIYSEWKYFLCVFKKLTFSEYSVPQIRPLPWNLGFGLYILNYIHVVLYLQPSAKQLCMYTWIRMCFYVSIPFVSRW